MAVGYLIPEEMRATLDGATPLDQETLNKWVEQGLAIKLEPKEINPILKPLEPKKVKFSKRELEVVELLKKGYRNRDIALKLKVHEKTVSTYKARILAKLGFTKKVNDYVIVRTAILMNLIRA